MNSDLARLKFEWDVAQPHSHIRTSYTKEVSHGQA